MGTSAPAVRIVDIPITKPMEKPLTLPAPDPERIVNPVIAPIPIYEPVRRIERELSS